MTIKQQQAEKPQAAIIQLQKETELFFFPPDENRRKRRRRKAVKMKMNTKKRKRKKRMNSWKDDGKISLLTAPFQLVRGFWLGVVWHFARDYYTHIHTHNLHYISPLSFIFPCFVVVACCHKQSISQASLKSVVSTHASSFPYTQQTQQKHNKKKREI